MRGSSGQTPSTARAWGSSAGIGEMLELEMSDSKAAKAAAQKAAKGNPTTISTRVRTLNGERLKVNDKMGQPHRDRQRGGVACGRYRQSAL